MSHIFISYSRKDQQYAHQLANQLLDAGFNIWIDDEIDYGDNWERIIFRAIDQCAVFLPVMSPDSYGSDWVQRECHYAEKRNKPTFPILLRGEEFPRYGLTQYADVRDSSLPKDDFLAEISEVAPRSTARGKRITQLHRQVKLPSRPVIKPGVLIVGSITVLSILVIVVLISLSQRPTLTPVSTEVALSVEGSQLSVEPTSEDSWTPVLQSFMGVDMVQVPPGCFEMGSTDQQITDARALLSGALYQEIGAYFLDEQPPHEVCFDQPFWIDRTEVSLQTFYSLGGQSAEDTGWPESQLPRTNLSWKEARDYCRLRGARLPTEAEWEYAARGPQNHIYPWGDNFDASKVIFDATGANGPVNVSSLAEGASWVGALHMSGNVWEWTSSLYQPYPYNVDDGRENSDAPTIERVWRGGSYYEGPAFMRSAYRQVLGTDDRFGNLGVRCVYDG